MNLFPLVADLCCRRSVAAGHENSDPQSAFLHAAAAKCTWQPRHRRVRWLFPVCALHGGIEAGHVSRTGGSLVLSVSALAFKVLNTLVASEDDDEAPFFIPKAA